MLCPGDRERRQETGDEFEKPGDEVRLSPLVSPIPEKNREEAADNVADAAKAEGVGQRWICVAGRQHERVRAAATSPCCSFFLAAVSHAVCLSLEDFAVTPS